MDKKIHSLWHEFLAILATVNSGTAGDLLRCLLGIVNGYSKELRRFADPEFLNFLLSADPDDFLVGFSWIDPRKLRATYERRRPESEKEVWISISGLIWDLTTYDSDETCPQCRSDTLRILTDGGGQRLYRSCETCFWTVSDGEIMHQPDGLLPANRETLEKGGFLGTEN